MFLKTKWNSCTHRVLRVHAVCSTSRASHLYSTSQKTLHPVSLLGLMAKIKCSICSYQFNIWYAGHRPAHILIWFLAFGQGSEACLTLTTGCLGIALQPSAAHYSIKKFGHIGLPVILTCYVIWSYDAIGLQALLLGPTLVCHVLFSTMLHHNIEENINECVPSTFMWGWRSL